MSRFAIISGAEVNVFEPEQIPSGINELKGKKNIRSVASQLPGCSG